MMFQRNVDIELSTTPRLRTRIYHITGSSQHDTAVGFQYSDSIAMRRCRPLFCMSARSFSHLSRSYVFRLGMQSYF